MSGSCTTTRPSSLVKNMVRWTWAGSCRVNNKAKWRRRSPRYTRARGPDRGGRQAPGAVRRGLAPWRQARSRCAAAPSQSRRKRRRQLMCNCECKYIADKPRQKYSETHFHFSGIHIRGCSSQNAFFNAESGMSDFGSTRLQVGDMAPALEWR